MPSSTARESGRAVRDASEAPRLNVVAVFLLLTCLAMGGMLTYVMMSPLPIIAGVVLGVVVAQSPRVANQWERAVVLRLGNYVGLRGPGLFWVVPFVDSVTCWLDQRVITTSFAAEESLTSDTVPVN